MGVDKRLQSERAIDYDGFTTLMQHLLDAAWGKGWGTFTSDAPSGTDPKNVTFPIITYSLKGLRPGLVGKDTREIRARHRYSEKRETNGNEPAIIKVLGQVLDAEIVFELWEESNAKVEKLAKRFREFMNIYTGYFISQGLRGIVFVVMNDIPENGKFRDNVQCRKFLYHVQFEEFTEVPVDAMNVIEQVNQLTYDISLRK